MLKIKLIDTLLKNYIQSFLTYNKRIVHLNAFKSISFCVNNNTLTNQTKTQLRILIIFLRKANFNIHLYNDSKIAAQSLFISSSN